MQARLVDGFAEITRIWLPGDLVELDLAMPVERVRADPRVRHDAGRVAVQRGPLVYCLEGCDHGADLDAVVLPEDAGIAVEAQPQLLGGVTTLHALGRRELPFDGGLYRTSPAATEAAPLTFIPYFAWDNRAPGAMEVWVRSTR